MERIPFYQKVIELAYPQVAIIAIKEGFDGSMEKAVANQLELLIKLGHADAKEFMRPFLLAAARQILNPVPQTDEYREQLNDIVRKDLEEYRIKNPLQ